MQSKWRESKLGSLVNLKITLQPCRILLTSLDLLDTFSFPEARSDRRRSFHKKASLPYAALFLADLRGGDFPLEIRQRAVATLGELGNLGGSPPPPGVRIISLAES